MISGLYRLAKDMSLYDIYTQAVQSIFGRPSGVRWEGPCGLYVPASDHHAMQMYIQMMR
jgi:hypothetical protein